MAKNRRKPAEDEYDEVLTELNDRQRAFIEFYLSCWNATDAARKAGYSDKTAQEQSSRLLSNVIIKNAIIERLKEHHADADEVIFRLSKHSRGSIELFLDENDELDLSLARKKGALALAKKIKRTRRTEPRKDKEPVIVTTLEIELYDAQAATVQLGKLLGLFVDKFVEMPWQEYLRQKGYDPATAFNGLVESIARAKEHAAAPAQQDDGGSSGRSGAPSASPPDVGWG